MATCYASVTMFVGEGGRESDWGGGEGMEQSKKRESERNRM